MSASLYKSKRSSQRTPWRTLLYDTCKGITLFLANYMRIIIELLACTGARVRRAAKEHSMPSSLGYSKGQQNKSSTMLDSE